MTEPILEPEWTHLFNVDDLGNAPVALDVSPDAEAYGRLARRLGVLSLKDLKSTLKIKRIGGTIHVDGTLDAVITQACVISAEPVETKVSDSFEAWYGEDDAPISLTKKRQEKMLEKGQTEIPLIEEKEDPEPVIDGHIDLGELITQYLSLGISPYPRADGATHESIKQDDDDAFSFKNPFAGLKDWKDKLTTKE